MTKEDMEATEESQGMLLQVATAKTTQLTVLLQRVQHIQGKGDAKAINEKKLISRQIRPRYWAS
jgi:hypothetical protein